MTPPAMPRPSLITLPPSPQGPLSIRAKALLFHDPASLRLQQQIERLAPTDASVLVIGETGTGKELVARHLHTLSGRSGPFLAVNCGAFTDSLIDAELFGHETGAYTSAGQSRAGWFEAANHGTLFLDEIGDLSLPLQVKLLRVLQEHQVVRLGSRRPIALDVRVVAATNIDLQRAVHAGRFRADLYYRLKVAQIHVRPLRQRSADVLPLAEHFMRLYATRMKLGPVRLSAQARQALLAYPWPGNIRELENIIHFGLIVARDGVVHADDLNLPSAQDLAEVDESATAEQASQAAGEASAQWQTPPPPPTLVSPWLPAAALPDLANDTPNTPQPAPQASSASNAEAAPMETTEDAPPTDAGPCLEQALAELFTRGLQDLPGTLWQTAERTLVETAYHHSRHNQMQAARLLGVSRNTMRTLLLRHGLLAGSD